MLPTPIDFVPTGEDDRGMTAALATIASTIPFLWMVAIYEMGCNR